MSNAKLAAERIREEVPILDVLVAYGYAVHPSGGDREQQFSCDLHGDGNDTKPSARVYPESSSFYCFACGRTRDAITLVREKEGLDFWPAVRALEQRYGLKPMAWVQEKRTTTQEEVVAALKVKTTASTVFHRTERFLLSMCREKSAERWQLAALWEAHDQITTAHYREGVGDTEAKALSLRVLDKAKTLLGVVS
jgi:DNA primase|tara:strand:+ start:1645 stop:2229 length:585 start_codon:yes stop_codon:yes gene_type:complete